MEQVRQGRVIVKTVEELEAMEHDEQEVHCV